ncbi:MULTISPECIES: DUF805 domain-containing protein [Clostridium]|uniref:DUF805 domain-containing protein n=1 Tax=Clostridium TaxID=1485 RepID=UPI00290F5363|nr:MULTISPECIES: DUF805 domain-containing protein [Clostridium]MDU4478293.1 DUF805 domain-containing protein [Clostridium sp.]CAI3579233.1 Inner membrane protein YhaI [Clostridium neonatale]CAI3591581.1 Inner membrane protein YhaI [Clostridium neonatale]CAI3600965.1 Inner membrane protein YhaI [Clostridium neonatale]CAI3663134.1 Inner membrane protein YhaI [Clostridium neonatale]
MNWYIEVLKKYADFNGRARRKEYWMFILFNIVIAIVLSVIDSLLGTAPIIYLVYILAVFIPSISVGVRRLHDIGKSGWWLFISFIPLVGGIWLLILTCKDSEPTENAYGVNPKVN